MFFRLLTFFVLFSSLFFSIVPAVSAHMIKSDSSVQATMHVSPDDDPTTGVQSEIHFEIPKNDQGFDWQTCECFVEVKKDDVVVDKVPLQIRVKEATVEAFTLYTFKEKAVYGIHFVGSVLQNGHAVPFELEYFMRVAKTNEPIEEKVSARFPDFWSLCILCGITLFFLGALTVLIYKRK